MPEFLRQNEPVPEGVYQLVIESVEEKKTSKGNDQLSLRLRVIEGEHEGRTIFHNWMLLPQSLWVIERDIEQIAGDKFFVNGKVKFDNSDLVGLTTAAVITVEDNTQGKLINKINRFMRRSDVSAAEEEVPF